MCVVCLCGFGGGVGGFGGGGGGEWVGLGVVGVCVVVVNPHVNLARDHPRPPPAVGTFWTSLTCP